MKIGSAGTSAPEAATATPIASTSATPTNNPLSRRRKPTVIRRWILLVLFVFYTVNCIDRASLPVAMPLIGKDFLLSPAIQGVLLSAFFWTYCLLQIPGGIATDRWGPRRVIGVASLIWGSFTALAGMAHHVTVLLLSRLGLGAFEAPYMPAAATLITRWLPTTTRARGITLIDSGGPLGSALGALVVTALITLTGSWRWPFLIVGLSTILIGIAVTCFIRNRPHEHPWVNKAEQNLIQVPAAHDDGADASPGMSRRSVAWMIVGRMGWAMVFWGLVTWGPSYLSQARGLSLSAMGFATFVIFLCGACGEILSGVLADRLLPVLGSDRAMKLLFGGSGVLSLIALAALPFVTNASVAVVLLCIGVFFILFGGLYWTIPARLASPEKVGRVGGLMNFAGTSAGVLEPLIAGLLIQMTHSYTAVLIYLAVCAAIYVISSVSIDFSAGRSPCRKNALTGGQTKLGRHS